MFSATFLAEQNNYYIIKINYESILFYTNCEYGLIHFLKNKN